MTPDIINGLFEFFGGVLLWANVRALHRSKKFLGVSIVPVAFFTSWGLWNLYLYPAVGLWWSFLGGINIVVYSGLLGARDTLT